MLALPFSINHSAAGQRQQQQHVVSAASVLPASRCTSVHSSNAATHT